MTIRSWWVSVLIWAMCAAPALAEYGKGRGETRLSGMLFMYGAMLILPLLLVLWLGARALVRSKKRRDAEALMEKLAAEDQAWDPRAFETRAREVFMAVAPVVSPEALESVKALFTPEGAATWTAELAKHQQAGKQRYFKLSDMIGVELLRVDDRLDDSEDRAWALIRFYGFDGLRNVSEPPESSIGGAEQAQIWKFRRSGDVWLLESFEVTSLTAVLRAPGSRSESN